jgi:hypothetical protein
MIKKIGSLCLSLVLVLSLVGCGNKEVVTPTPSIPQPAPEVSVPEVPETPEISETPESSEIDENVDVVIPEIENNTEDGNVDNPENNEGSQDYEKIDGEENSDVVSSENKDGNVDDTEENVTPIIPEEENFDNSDVNIENNLDNDSTDSVEETI